MESMDTFDISKQVAFLSRLSSLLKDYDQAIQMAEQADYLSKKYEVLGKYSDKADANKMLDYYRTEIRVIEQLADQEFNKTIIQARRTMSEFIGGLQIHEEVMQEHAKLLHAVYILDQAGLLVDDPIDVEVDESSGEPLTYLRSNMLKQLDRSNKKVVASMERLEDLLSRRILLAS